MCTLALWCVRHRRIVVAGWLLLVAGLIAVSSAVGTSYDNSLSMPRTESEQAHALVRAHAPDEAGATEQVVIAAKSGATLADPVVRAEAEALFARLAALPDVTGVQSPYASDATGQLSADGTIGFAVLTYAKAGHLISIPEGKALVDEAQRFRSDRLDVAIHGEVAVKAAESDLGGVGVGIIAALVVLLVIFGSLLAAVLPLVVTLLALPAASAVNGLLSHLVAIPEFSDQVVMLIGLGVGVDYALFIVTRMRQGLLQGHDVESSIATAIATSGRAVLFAGGVVCIALLALLALGIGLLSGIGIASSIGVLFTVISAVTLLPALLGFFGTKVLSRRQRRSIGAAAAELETGLWWRWSSLIGRRPLVPALIALTVIVALAIPVLSIRVGTSDAGNLSPQSSPRQAYDLLSDGFGPGFNGPLIVAGESDNPGEHAALQRVRAAIAGDPGVAAVAEPRVLSDNGTTRVTSFTVYPRTAPQDVATTDLVERLRSTVIPMAVGDSGATAFVGGRTAVSVDFARVLAERTPLFLVAIVLLSFLLLVVLLRSIVIPVTAVLMNILSAAASLGVLSAAYVWGWGGDLLGASREGPIEDALPVMVFAILFGLSMDYQVFLATRIQEEWQRTGNNKVAVTRGLAITGRTITAAALIMIVVFASFILGGDRLIKMFGLGLAAAVFIDAFLVRVAIVPATMFLLGRANWWLPKRLDAALPRLRLEAEVPVQRKESLELAGSGSRH